MAFARPKKRDPVGEAGLFEYAVGTLARKMRTVRDLKRLMRPRAFEGADGERDMDAVVSRLIDLSTSRIRGLPRITRECARRTKALGGGGCSRICR